MLKKRDGCTNLKNEIKLLKTSKTKSSCAQIQVQITQVEIRFTRQDGW